MYPNNTFYSTPYQSGVSIKVLLVIAVLALLLGFVLANTEILNPKRTQIELEEKQLHLQREKERSVIELEQQRKKALIEIERQRRQMEEDLAFRRIMHQVILDLTVVIGVAFAFGLMIGTAVGIILLIRFLLSRAPPPHSLPRQSTSVSIAVPQSSWYFENLQSKGQQQKGRYSYDQGQSTPEELHSSIRNI